MKISKDKPLRTEIKHKAILNAAKNTFLKQGYNATSMDEIALQANVSKRTIYDHFGTKKELFESMLNTHWEVVSTHNNQLFTGQGLLADLLKDFARAFLKFLYQQDTIALFRLLISEANQFPYLTSHIVIDGKAPFTRALIEFLDQKKTTGELSIDNPEQAASYFMGMLKEYHFWPMMLGFTKQKKPENQNDLINDVVAIFLKAYKKNTTATE